MAYKCVSVYYRGVRDVVHLTMNRGASLGGTESKLIQEKLRDRS